MLAGSPRNQQRRQISTPQERRVNDRTLSIRSLVHGVTLSRDMHEFNQWFDEQRHASPALTWSSHYRNRSVRRSQECKATKVCSKDVYRGRFEVPNLSKVCNTPHRRSEVFRDLIASDVVYFCSCQSSFLCPSI